MTTTERVLAERDRRRARRRAATPFLAALAAAALLAGCGGGGDEGGGPFDPAPQSPSPADGAPGDAPSGAPPAIEGVETWSGLARDHLPGDLDYPMNPPAGGAHNQAWMNCDADVYDAPVADENAVHSLEHGAVWVTYTEAAPEADVQALAARVSATPYTLMSPKPDQPNPLTLTAWGAQLSVESASDPRVEQFLTAYVQGPQTPEPGAPCGGGLTQ
ncbi:DUF3105 domain-containing protein [Streptomyces sp. DSM 44917]|uniref:DUF3105 domain-containing protein n=1 Tax=Streptomyces boetiae TaxID=3075541 RepID=A0ABU2L2Q8_9ACTN|nr:DUF3105 domain-containing protein [Streptomyces sp. DSM 44917]MDT0305851.1 DUF3105 domain-containing protein [Streptomyces sp. DSM 44917]